jgi:hypothetical protein
VEKELVAFLIELNTCHLCEQFLLASAKAVESQRRGQHDAIPEIMYILRTYSAGNVLTDDHGLLLPARSLVCILYS